MPKSEDLRTTKSEDLRTVSSGQLRSVDSGELRRMTSINPEHLCESPGDLGCSPKTET